MEAGLIGLGRMGTGIAKSLLRSEHRLTVFNRTRERAEALGPDGAKIAGSVAEACQSGLVLTMVADDAALEALVFGKDGILVSLRGGGVHVSLSTISVELSDRLAAEHAKPGQQFVAAPVFGRPEAAESAKLSVVAAGPSASVQRCKPLFESMGPKLFVVGERPSMANVVKLSGNFLIATVLESLAESLTFARKCGVDSGMLLDFLTTTMFTAPLYKMYGELIVGGETRAGWIRLATGIERRAAGAASGRVGERSNAHRQRYSRPLYYRPGARQSGERLVGDRTRGS